MTKIEHRFTIVQHSGYGYAYKPGFKKGLEMRMISNVTDMRKVQKAGGLLFSSYVEADDYCEQEVGPSLYPNAPGSFSDVKIDDLRIYIPLAHQVVKK